MHVTALSIFSCQADFELAQINLHQYQQLIRQTLQAFPPFQIGFSGITLSSTSITIPLTGKLLRKAFKQTPLVHTIDKRYVLKVAHSTLIRFKQPLSNPVLFADFLAQQQVVSFGTATVNTIDLVFNNWYMKAGNVELLERYPLE